MKKYILILPILFTLVSEIKSQEQTVIDSLKNKLIIEKNDTSRILILTKISRNYFGSNSDSLLKYAKIALTESESIHFLLGKAKSHKLLGFYHYSHSCYEDAIKNLKISEKIFKDINRMDEYANVFLIQGAIFTQQNNYLQALECYNKAIEIAKQNSDFLVLSPAYNNLGTVYMKLNDYDLALNYLNKSLNVKGIVNDEQNSVYTISNIASIHLDKKEYNIAIKHFNKSLKTFTKLNNKDKVANVNVLLAQCYQGKKMYDKAINYINKAILVYRELNAKYGIASAYLVKGSIYFEKKEYTKADVFLREGLVISENIDSKELKAGSCKYLAQLDSINKNYKSSLINYHKYINLKNEIFNETNRNKIARQEIKLKKSEQEIENKFLQKEQELTELKFKKQKNITNFMWVLAALLVFIVSLIIYSWKRLKKTNDNLEFLVDQRTKDLNLALLEAKKSDELKTEFLMNLSHEIRTPMNAVLGFSSIIKAGKTKLNERHIETVQKSMDALLKTINRLITFSKYKLEEYKVKKEAIKLTAFINEIETNILNRRDFLNKQNIDIKIVANKNELPLYFNTDIEVLKNICSELISNALKFTKVGDITISVSVVNKNKLLLKVKDTGVGIKKEAINYVFDYTRKFDTTNELYRGMGVGLALVKKAVEILNGDIKIISDENKGAEFIVSIPEL